MALELESYSKLRAIFGVAIPAALQNAAGPLTATFQTALLANYAGSTSLAAYAAVNISANFATRVFNFLVDGVSAKVGSSVGEQDWEVLAFRVKLSLMWAFGAGCVASLLLAFAKAPVFGFVLELQPDVLLQAQSYWWLRCALVPVLLLNMSISGILQGFHQVRVSATLNTCQSLLELSGTATVLAYRIQLLGATGLMAVGLVSAATQLLLSVTGFCCVLFLSPGDAGVMDGQGRRFRLWDEWVGRKQRTAKGSTRGGKGLGEGGDAKGLWRWGRQGRLWRRGGWWWQRQKQQQWLEKCRSWQQRGWGVSGVEHCSSEVRPPELEPCDSVTSFRTLFATHGAKGRVQELEEEGGCIREHSDEREGLLSVGEWEEEGEEEVVVGRALVLAASVPSADHVAEDGGSGGAAAASAAARKEHLLDFVRDGLNMLVRSMVIQVTFFASLVAASRLGTASLAAHSIIGQLWILVSYIVDGFAAAGIVLGSRLAAHARNPATAAIAKRQMQRLVRRVLSAGLVSGVGAGMLFAAYRTQLLELFTPDHAIRSILMGGPWLVLVLVQPINGMVFVYDGLMYASQSFTYIRNMMLLGLLLAFCPLLALELWVTHALWGIWVANAAVNLWRVCGAAWLIHGKFIHEMDDANGGQQALEQPLLEGQREGEV